MNQFSKFLVDHWELWLLLAIILLLILLDEYVSRKKRPPSLTPAEVINSINEEDAKVIDLRNDDMFRKGHIINSLRASPEDFKKPRLEKFKDKPIILVCTRGLQSQTLATKLKKEGYTVVMYLQGGMNSWTAAGFPIEKLGKQTSKLDKKSKKKEQKQPNKAKNVHKLKKDIE